MIKNFVDVQGPDGESIPVQITVPEGLAEAMAMDCDIDAVVSFGYLYLQQRAVFQMLMQGDPQMTVVAKMISGAGKATAATHLMERYHCLDDEQKAEFQRLFLYYLTN